MSDLCSPFEELACKRPVFASYWKDAQRVGLPQRQTAFQIASSNDLEASRQLHRQLLHYLRRSMEFSLEPASDSRVLYAVFSPDGILTHICGSTRAIDNACQEGIRVGTRWGLEALGPNAISVGLAKQASMQSTGDENYSSLCRSYCLYFEPIQAEEADSSNEISFMGGVAILVPATGLSHSYLTQVRFLAHSMMMELHFSWRSHQRYNAMDKAVITCVYKAEKKPRITYCDEKFFQFLEIPQRNAMMQPLEKLIDPPPRNRVFWNLLASRTSVSGRELTLRIGDLSVPCLLDVSFHAQPYLGINGCSLYFTTPKKIAESVSQKIGNTAVRGFDSIIGQSAMFRRAVEKGRLLAGLESNIMILGESGTGKDVFAQAIHNSSCRAAKPFIAVNCGALPRDLIASELFGYEEGAFTGAKRQGNIGKFELANGGTLFLDEIGELPLDMQATLLRVVEQKKFTRLGGSKEITADVRIICATNANLPEMIGQKRFREDLFYRLSTMSLRLPPLRERDRDVILLAEHFIRTVSKRINRTLPIQLSPAAQQLLLQLPWYGNVRELQNLMECITSLYPDPVIEPQHLLDNIRSDYYPVYESPVPSAVFAPPAIVAPPQGGGPNSAHQVFRGAHGKRVDLSRQVIRDTLELFHGNRSAVSQYLGISRNTLYRYIREYKL